MDKSLRKFGLGRSILIDRNNRIIAGNKTAEKAADIGIGKVVIVETDGTSLVAVKRNDIDLDTSTGREMALADNATGKANLSFDTELIFEEVGNLDFTPEDWGIELPESVPLEGGDEEGEGKVTMTVTCDDSRMMLNLFDELRDRGFACELKGG